MIYLTLTITHGHFLYVCIPSRHFWQQVFNFKCPTLTVPLIDIVIDSASGVQDKSSVQTLQIFQSKNKRYYW